jgi:DNA polymerase-3 subunit alpha
MGKKKPEEMAKHRNIFVEGAVKNGYTKALAEQLFDLMAKFAEYGFNKSHTAAYAVVTYQTAWLKAHHCAAFMAATLSSDMDNTDAVQIFHQDALGNGLKVLPPDINASQYRFVPVSRAAIRYGLGAVKGTGESAIDVIFKAREKGGPFRDLFDFCMRVDKRLVNRRAIEALVRAGAFDAISPLLEDGRADRASVLASVGVAMEAAEQAERNALQGGLFDFGAGAASGKPQYVSAQPWSERERLLQEKQAIGFYLSGHPFSEHRAELGRFVRRTLDHLEPQREAVLIAGIVVGTRTQMTRRGKMAIVVIEDGTAQIEVSVFNELYEAQRKRIVNDEVLVVEGKVQKDDFTSGLRVVADKLMSLAEARGRFAKALKVAMNGEANAQKLRALLAPFRNGPCPVRLCYRNAVAECELPLGEAWRVRLDDELLRSLHDWLKPENIEIEYR